MATRYAQAAVKSAKQAAHHARLAALHSGWLPEGAHLPPQRPATPDAGESLLAPLTPADRTAPFLQTLQPKLLAMPRFFLLKPWTISCASIVPLGIKVLVWGFPPQASTWLT